MTLRYLVATLAVSLLSLAAACEGTPPAAPGAQIALSVAPLDYPGVTNAAYTLTVKNKSGQTVFTRSLDSRAYGDGTGALSYVGPCDAEPSENPNTVSLTLTGLFAGATGATAIDPSTYHNPGELTRSATCTENADTPVTFDITLARAAQQGFFDVAVTFENIFCSAKLDCVDQDGQTLALLHTASGARGRSVVLGLACTGDLSPSGETYLYRTPIVVTCTGGTATVDPSAGPGNLAAGTGYTTTGTSPLFAAAVYRGEEQLSFNKRYWNVVLGLADTAQSCTVSTRATASPDPLVGGNTPAGTTWPYVVWSRALTDASSARACTRHPVDGAAPNDGVATVYTAADVPLAFPFAFGPTAPAVPTACIAGQTSCPYATCDALAAAGLAPTDGAYVLDPDGPGAGAAALSIYCRFTAGVGWALVGHYVHESAALDATGAAVGAAPILPTDTTSKRLSDATVQALAPTRYLVESGTSHARNPACDTYYELLTPATWSSSTNYTSLRCSKNQALWGAAFDPDGISLTTQAGPGNWEKNYCVPSGGGQGTTAQWMYYNNAMVQGDDLCANGGGPNNADKWLWVRTSVAPALCVPGQLDCPHADCQAVLQAGLSTGDGAYAVDPDGPSTGAPALTLTCDMSSDGGGWTRVGVGSWLSQYNTMLRSDALPAHHILTEATLNALRASSEHLFRLGSGATRFYVRDTAPLFTSHYWRTNAASVQCATSYAPVSAGTMTTTSVKSMNCDPLGVGTHTCGVTSGWILLHDSDPYNPSGAHPCSLGVGGNPTGRALTDLWLR